MIQRLFNTMVVVALFSSMAMAQAGPMGGFMEGPGVVSTQEGPGGAFMGGPMPSFGTREMIIRTGHGPNVFFRARWRDAWWKNPEIAQKVGLSDQQTQQLEKINQEGALKMIDLRATLEKQEVILAPMMQAYRPDQAEVLAQVEKVSQARAALEKARVQTMLASRSVLTEEQWKKLQDTRMGFHRTWGPRGFQHPRSSSIPNHPSGQ